MICHDRQLLIVGIPASRVRSTPVLSSRPVCSMWLIPSGRAATRYSLDAARRRRCRVGPLYPQKRSAADPSRRFPPCATNGLMQRSYYCALAASWPQLRAHA